MESFFRTPADILSYLWFWHTGFMKIIEPKTLCKKYRQNRNGHDVTNPETSKSKRWSKDELKLKYSRAECTQVAKWLNELDLPIEKSCEIMHPKRGVWIRMIRALRLSEYARKKGFEKLKSLLDEFYREEYYVWRGEVDKKRIAADATGVLELLKERPEEFIRILFASMLQFGGEKVVKAFEGVLDKVTAGQILSLNTYAKSYFNRVGKRVVRPVGSFSKTIANNRLTQNYTEAELIQMQQMIADLCNKSTKG